MLLKLFRVLLLVNCISILFLNVDSVPLPKPINVVYTGEGCPCPAALSYKMNAPFVPLQTRSIGKEYNYRVEVPPAPSSHMNYRFDFTVEEPPPPKIRLQKKLNLFAKVDRITMHKNDCTSSPPAPCSCGHYRYVNQLCKCNRPQCQCNTYPSTQVPSSIAYVQARGNRANTISRRKRELHNILFQKRPLRNDRPARFVKLYHKDLQAANKYGIFNLKPFTSKLDRVQPSVPLATKTKRKVKKVLSPIDMWSSSRRLVKRDIKGEYDLLERERENIDFTVPEIIQYMPETLQPNFKPRQCYFGCSRLDDDLSDGKTSGTDQNRATSSTVGSDNDKTLSNSEKSNQQQQQHEEFYEKNSITNKRNIDAFDYGPLLNIQTIEPAAESYKFLSDNTPLRKLLSTTSVPDPLGISSIPLKFTGDLESAHLAHSFNLEPLLGAYRNAGAQYPIEHVSNEQLDRMIADIVYRHPSYIEATAHVGGDLVDPEPIQKKQTKDFLKKLFSGHLSLWNTEDFNDFIPTADDILPFGYRSIGDIETDNYHQSPRSSITSFLPVLF